MEEGGGVEKEAAKLAMRAENKGSSAACEPDLTSSSFVGEVCPLHCTSERAVGLRGRSSSAVMSGVTRRGKWMMMSSPGF